MVRRPLAAAAVTVLLGFGATPLARAVETPELKDVDFSFDGLWEGIFGTFEQDQLRRGYQVYSEVCASCHAMRFLHYRHLGDEGGPHFTEEEVKAIAARYEVTDGPDRFGEFFQRPARPADPFVKPYPNDEAARAANGGALPPDLSLITKSRENGPDYVYSLLTGYHEPPPGFELREGLFYNPYFPGAQIAMPPPLSDGLIEYTDGTPATVEQMAMDVSAFLHWAAEPKLVQRREAGFKTIIYLAILAGLLYASYRKVWARIHH